MKISAIKTVIQKPLKKMLPLTLGALTLVGCQSSTGRIKDYCRQFDKSAKDCTSYINSAGAVSTSNRQAVLDSLIYRDLVLNKSDLANDSSVVAEFNKISATNRYLNPDFETNLLDAGIPTDDYFNLIKKFSSRRKQFLADKFMFETFFKEKGLMTIENEKFFKEIAKFLNPDVDGIAEDLKNEI